MKNNTNTSRNTSRKNIAKTAIIMLSLAMLAVAILAIVGNKGKAELPMSPAPTLSAYGSNITEYGQKFIPVEEFETFILSVKTNDFDGELQFRWYIGNDKNGSVSLNEYNDSDYGLGENIWEIGYKIDELHDNSMHPNSSGVGGAQHEDRVTENSKGETVDTTNIKMQTATEYATWAHMTDVGYFVDNNTTSLPVRSWKGNAFDSTPDWVNTNNTSPENVEIFRLLVRGKKVGFTWSKPTVVDIVLGINAKTDGAPSVDDDYVTITRPADEV